MGELLVVSEVELCDQMVMTMRMRNFSPSTIKSYLSYVRGFVRMFGKSPTEMGEREVQQYLEKLMEQQKSWALIRIAASALKVLYVDTLHREWNLGKLPRPRREKRLPVILSKEEVIGLFQVVKNIKHRAVLMTCYSAGLRVSEVVHLKLTDIDSQRMQIRVEQGKGKKDRYTILSSILLDELRRYWRVYRTQEWLFCGQKPDRPLSVRRVQDVLTKAKKKPGS